MTTTIGTARAGAARRVARLLATDRGRRMFKRNGYTSGTPIIPAHEDETIASVMSRVAVSGADTTVLAVHFPLRSEDQEMVFVEIERTAGPEGDVIRTGRGESTIGMLVDGMNGGVGSFSIAADVVLHRFDLSAA